MEILKLIRSVNSILCVVVLRCVFENGSKYTVVEIGESGRCSIGSTGSPTPRAGAWIRVGCSLSADRSMIEEAR